ncbi:uncharacterized protein LOC119615284 [Lucilia sericata]|uniref:uncharacterized protein LOC119615284 n=1 Tax=Lucilia sericata TaxID=13632 RepID=UPI0018A86DDF|nr:uncharacterized protein LOC119615284 [Lucilia sericata]
MFSFVGFVPQRNNDLRLQRRELRDNSNPMELPDSEFRRNFRVCKEVFQDILHMVAPHFSKTYRQTAIHPTLKVAIFLKFLATGSYQRPVGNDFLGCVSQSTFCRILDECLSVFSSSYCPKQICFKMSQSEEQNTKRRIHEKFNFPGVIAFVDGTHIRIKCPSSSDNYSANNWQINPESY